MKIKSRVRRFIRRWNVGKRFNNAIDNARSYRDLVRIKEISERLKDEQQAALIAVIIYFTSKNL